jgi:DNA-binding MarR family transcriptional regulator
MTRMPGADGPRHEDRLAAEAEAMSRALVRLVWVEQKQFALQLARLGLTLPQYLALAHLARVGPGCSMGGLAERMHQSSATMTGIVDRLVRMGLAERQRDPSDRRLVIVVLTETGDRLLDQAYALQRRRTMDALATFSERDRRRLLDLLQAYLRRAEAQLDLG